jgi:hypothetical protein
VTEIIMARGKCVYWQCGKPTRGIYCREHQPTRCRVCGCEPYGSRGLTYGLCLRHYKYWARHESPQREKILAGDRRKSARRTQARLAARRLKEAAAAWGEQPWQPAEGAEWLAAGGWDSGSCLPNHGGLVLVEPMDRAETG